MKHDIPNGYPLAGDTPPKYEWDFSGLPEDQLELSCAYEYDREKRRQRGQSPRSESRPWRDIENHKRIESVKANNEWLRTLRSSTKPAFKVIEPGEGGTRWSLFVDAAIIEQGTFDAYPELHQILRPPGRVQTIVCEINLGAPSGDIMREFAAWLRTAHSPVVDRRGSTLRRSKELLKALGALRLLLDYRARKRCSQEKAIIKAQEMTQEVCGKPLYATRDSWVKAASKADKLLKPGIKIPSKG